MGTVFHIEFKFLDSPNHTFIVRTESPITSGEAIKKAINEYDPYLLLSVVGAKITYIGD